MPLAVTARIYIHIHCIRRSLNVSRGADNLLNTGSLCSSTVGVVAAAAVAVGECSSGSLQKNEHNEVVGDWLRLLHAGLPLSNDRAGLRAAGLGLGCTLCCWSNAAAAAAGDTGPPR